MTGIALRRSAKRTLAQIEIQPRRKFVNRVRQDGSIPPGVDDGSESVFEEDETEDGSSSPDSPESPKSPDSPTSEAPFPIQPPATSLNLPPPRPTDTIRLNPPQAETTQPATTTTAVRPPPPPPITTAAPVVSPPTVRPSLPVVVTTTTPPPAGGPTTTLVPIAPPQSPPVVTRPTRATTIRDPARESGDSSTETALPPTVAPPAGGPTTTLTPIAPPRTTGESSTLTLDSTATSIGTTTTRIESPTTSQASATTTQVTTRFVISSTGLNNGVPTTVLITLPNGSETTFSTRLSTTSTRRVSTTTSAGFIPSESVIIPSSISALPTSKPETNIEGSTRQSTIGVGGVAALSIVIALASIATIVFVVYKCCWPQRLRDRPLSGSTAFGPIRKFWQKPRSAASRGGGDDSLPGHAQPQMAHVRPDGKIMDQVMAAAYEAEQGNAGVYGRYADRHRASWHTDDSSILEEKQRQYEAAVAASAINGTPPPPVTQGRALQLGQMMGAFLKDKHDKPKPAEAEMPRSPAGTTSGPTAFMPKDHRVEWSWRVSVGDQFRRASQNLRSEDGFWSKAAKGFKK